MAEMASVGATLRYTTVAFTRWRPRPARRNRRVWRRAAGPGRRRGLIAEPWRPAWRLKTCRALAAMSRACPNWSCTTIAVSAVSCASPLFWRKQRMRSRRGACSSKVTRHFDAGKRCLSLRILRRHTRSSVIPQLVTVVQAHAVLWSGFRTWSNNQVHFLASESCRGSS